MNIKEVLSYLVSEKGREDLRAEIKARLLKANLPSALEQVVNEDGILEHIFNFDGQDVAVVGYIENEDRLIVKYLGDYPSEDEYVKLDISNMSITEMLELIYSL